MTETPHKLVDAHVAFGLLFELFKHAPWLLNKGHAVRLVEGVEADAIAFLRMVAAGEANDWGELDVDVRSTASGLLIDFLTKLQGPGAPLSRATWTVPAKAAEWQQALAVIEQQIRRAHPRQTAPH